jgi:RimJ/RimL family protein N-acetyltransferase
VDVVALSGAALAALAAGDRAGAELATGRGLSDYLTGPGCAATWRRRRDQVLRDPAVAAWVTGLVVDLATGAAVGRAGFHDFPDRHGLVEVGYAIDPAYRRRGYATSALGVLLDRAAREPDVRVVRASVRPDNEPSLRIVRAAGFTEVGDQWDPDDGLELVFERPARCRA